MSATSAAPSKTYHHALPSVRRDWQFSLKKLANTQTPGGFLSIAAAHLVEATKEYEHACRVVSAHEVDQSKLRCQIGGDLVVTERLLQLSMLSAQLEGLRMSVALERKNGLTVALNTFSKLYSVSGEFAASCGEALACANDRVAQMRE